MLHRASKTMNTKKAQQPYEQNASKEPPSILLTAPPRLS
jgi:hypothetical protein